MASSRSRTLSKYHNWTREELIAQLEKLDVDSSQHEILPRKEGSFFNFASHPRRKIALKFCYSGQEYNGMAFQKDKTPLPTVEGVLFNALTQTRLIDPNKGFEGCGWERCGRTDRGVSAAGQVISLWVRSAINDGIIPDSDQTETASSQGVLNPDDVNDELPLLTVDAGSSFSSRVTRSQRSSIATSEIPYIQVLNRVLPSTIRIIAWSPVAETFSARFSCQFRHYKYFFPATKDLSIPRMEDAVGRLVGSHDFRNLCTLDGSRQIDNYIRHISHAEISQIGPDESAMDIGPMYVFNLIGNAFLYNQVRNIMAILFLVGSGLEEPHVLSSLMNGDPKNPVPPYRPGEKIEVVDRKPSYQMAIGLPLVLWDCGYLTEDVKWQTDDDPPTATGETESVITSNVRHQLSSIYMRSRIRSVIDGHFLRASSRYHDLPYTPLPFTDDEARDATLTHEKTTLNIPVGAGVHIRTAKYIPLLNRARGDTSEAVNERWRQGRGKKRLERQKLQGEDTPSLHTINIAS
ncbi:hypothetical protein Clacol_003491 [Clathrus columnatus]|uniref:Pseudouridine synthase I TruA alpha/beta domain-containing protein n=1 Tax=Clathrus columnatus TaxID=1419009 RepID=A0AAV5A3N4_9AGAM|nr:hypothetical protein Clacol_003491 [Clathrus columnatus]